MKWLALPDSETNLSENMVLCGCKSSDSDILNYMSQIRHELQHKICACLENAVQATFASPVLLNFQCCLDDPSAEFRFPFTATGKGATNPKDTTAAHRVLAKITPDVVSRTQEAANAVFKSILIDLVDSTMQIHLKGVEKRTASPMCLAFAPSCLQIAQALSLRAL